MVPKQLSKMNNFLDGNNNIIFFKNYKNSFLIKITILSWYTDVSFYIM